MFSTAAVGVQEWLGARYVVRSTQVALHAPTPLTSHEVGDVDGSVRVLDGLRCGCDGRLRERDAVLDGAVVPVWGRA